MALPVVVGELEATLREMLAEHAALLEMLHAGRAALRSGDAAGAAELCRREHERAGVLSRLERRRQGLVQELVGFVAHGEAKVDTQGAPRLVEVAAGLPEPYRERLLSLRERLLEGMREVKRETGVARRAVTSLLRHATGMISHMAAAAGTGGSYSLSHAPRATPAVRTFKMSA